MAFPPDFWRIRLQAFSNLQQLACFRVTRSGLAVLAGRHAGQADELPPAIRRANEIELLADRPIVLLGVESAVFARRITEQQIEDGTRRLTELAVTGHGRAGDRLVLGLDGVLGLAE